MRTPLVGRIAVEPHARLLAAHERERNDLRQALTLHTGNCLEARLELAEQRRDRGAWVGISSS